MNNKNDYFNFIDTIVKNRCINKSYKKIYDIKEQTSLIPKNSNIQINHLIEQIFKLNNVIYYNYLLQLFCHFMSFDDSIKLINHINGTKMTDSEILSYIDKNIKQEKNKIYSNNYVCNRREYAFSFLKDCVNNVIQLRNNVKYLDVGCGDGVKTNIFAKIFNIQKSRVHGTDIQSWGPYSTAKKFDFDFKHIINDEIKYEDNTFDLMTCFLTLHHIKNMDKIISEMYRILKNNGILIIVEHDINNSSDQLIVDIEHLLYAHFYDKNKDYLKNPDYALYFNNMEFNYLLTKKNKFKLLHTDTYYETIDNHKKYDQQFFQIYKK